MPSNLLRPRPVSLERFHWTATEITAELSDLGVAPDLTKDGEPFLQRVWNDAADEGLTIYNVGQGISTVYAVWEYVTRDGDLQYIELRPALPAHAHRPIVRLYND